MSEELHYDIVQEQTTTLVAHEGYILVRAATGSCATEIVHLGVNWYDEGVPLATREMASPSQWVAIPKPEGWDEEHGDPNSLIDQVAVLRRTQELYRERVGESGNIGMTNRQAQEMKASFAVWAIGMSADVIATLQALNITLIREGDSVAADLKFLYKGELWEVVKEHPVYEHYYPDVSTLANYRRLPMQNGTFDDPIEYEVGMKAKLGEYFLEGETTYECIEAYDGSTAHMPSELSRYFKAVSSATEDSESTEGTETEGTESGGESTEGNESTEGTTAEEGTYENPIVWTGSGILYNGKYYIDGDVTYLCNRDSGNSVTYALSALVGLYVEVVEV